MISETGTSRHVIVGENLPAPAVPGLADFIETHYLTPNLHTFQGSSYKKSGRKEDGTFDFSWKIPVWKLRAIGGMMASTTISVYLSISQQAVTIDFTDFDESDPRANEVCAKNADDIKAIFSTFLASAKKTSLYFVFSLTGGSMEAPPSARGMAARDVLKRIFAGNMTNLYLTLVGVSLLLFSILGNLAIFVMIAVQALALFNSDKLILSMGNVHPTEDKPEVTIISITSTPQTSTALSNVGRKLLLELREELGNAISSGVADRGEVKSSVYSILRRSGIQCSPDDVEIKTRNPYAVVQSVSAKFLMKAPRMVIVNTAMDNAAATGISSSRAAITITAGSLEDMSDEELESVVGHEFGHVKGHDPLILFCITAFMYIGGFYLWPSLLLELGIVYFIIAFGVIFSVGKFMETRADTESAMVIGKPAVLASALTNVGFARLYYERYSSRARLLDWLVFDPHPPIYFRVKRLSEIAAKGEKIRHTLLVSIRDCLSGFLRALIGVD
jgi:heat shock protein HtpX